MGGSDRDPRLLGSSDTAIADTLSSDAGPTEPLPANSGTGAIKTAPLARGPRMVRSGDVLGRYELGEELGEGGMATVFLARDRELRRDVAVKVLFPHLARRDETVRRFQREARAAAGLEHRNILRVYDVGGAVEDDPPYIVMELVRGRSLLGELEHRGPMLAEVVACIGALLAEALAVAHAAGIVHRDVKPANVMVASGGRLLLADFGVARLETEDSLVTKTGALLGTPAYMSPEQASGEVATAKSDVYSLGALLYQLATGSLPYTGSPAKVLAQIAQGTLVAPVRKHAGVGPDLSRVIMAMMATELGDRPASATVVATELRAVAVAGGLGEPADELAAYFGDTRTFETTRVPGVVRAMVTAARQAIADAKLPRAMALADRASSLAPDDAEVAALVQTVTDGGRATSRRRALAIGALGLGLAGGAVAGGVALFGHHAVVADAHDAGGSGVAIAASADPDAADDGGGGGGAIGASGVVPFAPDAQPLAVVVVGDAEPGLSNAGPRDAGVRVRDAATAAIAVGAHIDAAEVAMMDPPDAPTVTAAPVAIDAGTALVAHATATLAVQNDTWCTVSIDGAPAGKIVARGKPLALTVQAGTHRVECRQDATGLAWTRTVDAVAGTRVPVIGTLLASTQVVLGIAGDHATIDGARFARGATATVTGGQHRARVLKAGQVVAEGWFTATAKCRLHEDGSNVVCDLLAP